MVHISASTAATAAFAVVRASYSWPQHTHIYKYSFKLKVKNKSSETGINRQYKQSNRVSLLQASALTSLDFSFFRVDALRSKFTFLHFTSFFYSLAGFSHTNKKKRKKEINTNEAKKKEREKCE